jgi:hypothetical protein
MPKAAFAHKHPLTRPANSSSTHAKLSSHALESAMSTHCIKEGATDDKPMKTRKNKSRNNNNTNRERTIHLTPKKNILARRQKPLSKNKVHSSRGRSE